MQTFNPVVWFEIYVQDMARAQRFYEQVLGVKLETLAAPEGEASGMHMLSFPGSMENGGASGALVKVEGAASGGGNASGPAGTMVYFGCEDCAVEAGRVQAAGGRICQDKFAIGEYGFCAIATDTEGNTFGLHSMK
ncbi:VOC family protein [Luteimonas sp. e5]